MVCHVNELESIDGDLLLACAYKTKDAAGRLIGYDENYVDPSLLNDSGLIFDYRFNGAAESDAELQDDALNDNPLTITGSNYAAVPGMNGGYGVQLGSTPSNSDTYFGAADIIAHHPAGDWEMDFWINPLVPGGSDYGVFSKYTGSPTAAGIRAYFDSGGYIVCTAHIAGTAYTPTYIAVPSGLFLYTVRYHADTLTLEHLVNNDLSNVQSLVLPVALALPPVPILFGDDLETGGHFTGFYGNAQMWGRILSAEERARILAWLPPYTYFNTLLNGSGPLSVTAAGTPGTEITIAGDNLLTTLTAGTWRIQGWVSAAFNGVTSDGTPDLLISLMKNGSGGTNVLEIIIGVPIGVTNDANNGSPFMLPPIYVEAASGDTFDLYAGLGSPLLSGSVEIAAANLECVRVGP